MEAKDDGSSAPLSPSSQAKQDDRKKIVQLVMEFAMSENFEQDFEDFAASHKSSFIKILVMDTNAEHPMEWHEIYMEYLRTFEGKIERFIASVGFEINDFYEECKIILEDTKNVSGEARFFLEALMATSEYQTFITLMKGEMVQFMHELEDDEIVAERPSESSAELYKADSLNSGDRLDSKEIPTDDKEEK